MRTVVLAMLMLAALPVAAAQQDEHNAGITRRGDQAMGFAHDKTSHHFRLYRDGGTIEASANQPNDTTSRDMIRTHFTHIAKMFAAGDFNIPMFIHDAKPPGAATMAELRDKISYQYEETSSGARIRITSADPRGVDAVHKFLRFQIAEHKTGDSGQVETASTTKR